MSTHKNKTALIALMLAFGLAVSNAIAPRAQECVSDLSQFAIGGKTAGNDGKIHVKYGYVDQNGTRTSAPQGVGAAVEAAVADWNRYSGTTGVVFEPAGPNDHADIEFRPEPDIDTPCGYYSPSGERIEYHPTGLAEAAAERPAFAAGVIAHELGHYLGLDHTAPVTSPPTVMNAPVVHPGDRCKDLTVGNSTVQPGDATKAASCMAQARQQHSREIASALYDYNYSYTPSCYTYYEVTDHYICWGAGWDSCSFWYSDYRYMYSTCMLTQ